jgi:hypothetical protein
MILAEELAKLRQTSPGGDRYDPAAELFRELTAARSFPQFPTTAADDLMTAAGRRARSSRPPARPVCPADRRRAAPSTCHIRLSPTWTVHSEARSPQ